MFTKNQKKESSMTLKNHLFVYVVFLLVFSANLQAERGTNKHVVKPIKQVPDEVLRWSVFSVNPQNDQLRILSLGKQKLLIQQGSTIKSMELPPHFYQLTTAPHGFYFALSQILPANKEQKVSQLFIAVYQDVDQLLFKIQYPLQYSESIPSIILLDNGNLILAEPVVGQLQFYASSGEMIQQIELFKDATYNLERVLMVAPAAIEFNRIAVLASKGAAAPLDADLPLPSSQPYLFLFDLKGNELWRQALPEAAAAHVAIAPDAKHIIVGVYSAYRFKPMIKKTLLLNNDGSILNTFPMLFRYASFAKESPIAVIADRFSLHQIDLQKGKILWQHHFLPKTGMITAVSVNKDGQQTTVLTALNRFANHRFEFQQPQLHLFNQQGMIMDKIPFTNEKFLTPALFPIQNQIFIGFTKNLYKLEVSK